MNWLEIYPFEAKESPENCHANNSSIFTEVQGVPRMEKGARRLH